MVSVLACGNKWIQVGTYMVPGSIPGFDRSKKKMMLFISVSFNTGLVCLLETTFPFNNDITGDSRKGHNVLVAVVGWEWDIQYGWIFVERSV